MGSRQPRARSPLDTPGSSLWVSPLLFLLTVGSRPPGDSRSTGLKSSFCGLIIPGPAPVGPAHVAGASGQPAALTRLVQLRHSLAWAFARHTHWSLSACYRGRPRETRGGPAPPPTHTHALGGVSLLCVQRLPWARELGSVRCGRQAFPNIGAQGPLLCGHLGVRALRSPFPSLARAPATLGGAWGSGGAALETAE